MSQTTWKLRPATEEDISSILGLIKELALYEKAPERVEATEDSLRKTLYGPRPYAEVVLAVDGETAVGMALFVRDAIIRTRALWRTSSLMLAHRYPCSSTITRPG